MSCAIPSAEHSGARFVIGDSPHRLFDVPERVALVVESEVQRAA